MIDCKMRPKQTSADRTCRYRQRMSETKKQQAREDNNQKHKEQRAKMTAEKRKTYNANGALRKYCSRMKAKAMRVLPVPISPNKAFKSKQSFAKALKRVKRSLPISPRKKTAVVRSLAKEFQAHTVSENEKRRSPTTRRLLLTFIAVTQCRGSYLDAKIV